MTTLRPRYPVYVPSKGRAHLSSQALTVTRLLRDGCPFRLVVEPAEVDSYARAFPDAELLVLPENGLRLLGSRLWIREHAIAEGHERHWQLDDNIKDFRRLVGRRRIPCSPSLALRVCEQFTDRYENIGVSGLNYQGFVPPGTSVPFYLNCHVYSCSLIWNRMPYKWRLIYNDDTDLCLQVLAGGLCTVALNIFMADKLRTMVATGGNTTDLYQADGRLRMARSLERQWPHVVYVDRRWDRPQHVITGAWRGFDTPLRRRTDIDWDALPAVDESEVRLVEVDEVRAPGVREIVAHFQGG